MNKVGEKMKSKITSILIVSLVINLVFAFGLVGQKINSNSKDTQIKTLTSSNENLSQKVKQYDANANTQTLLTGDKIKSNIGNFINALFNYTNKNYVSRYGDIQKYASPDVYNALKGAGDIGAPTTKIQDRVSNLNVYLTTNSDQTITALVNISTIYSVNGNDSAPINQIYELELTQQGKDNWIITKYTLMGNFEPYSTNK
jgi:hypothetical protein